MKKDISIGPTTTSTLLALPLVAGISTVAKLPALLVLPALTLAVSIWFLLFGVLGLGFLFDLIPVFFCIALVTAFAIIALSLQIPLLLGLLTVPPSFMAIIPGTIASISHVSGRTVAVSVSALVFLGVVRALARKWGPEPSVRGRLAQYGVALGGLVVIFVFTGVSSALLSPLPLQQQLAPVIPSMAAAAGVATSQAALGNTSTTTAQMALGSSLNATKLARNNNNNNNMALVDPMLRRAQLVETRAAAAASLEGPIPTLPFWPVFPPFNTTTIPPASGPPLPLVQALFLPSFVLFLAINIEHLVVARFFAHEQTYTISKSQEMFALGVINLVNALFGGVPVGGGDMTRSSVLGFAGAQSPLNQLVAGATVLVTVQAPALSNALRFLPQAALAALTFLAIFDQMPPQALMNVYFKLSFADFVAFFIVMNVGIAGPAGMNGLVAIGLGVLYMVLYTLLRGMFAGPKFLTSHHVDDLEARRDEPWVQYAFIEKEAIPASALVVTSDVDLVWTNAERMYRHILDAAFLYHSGTTTTTTTYTMGVSASRPEPAWNMQVHRRIRSLRRQHERAREQHRHQTSSSTTSSSSPPPPAIAFRPRLRMVILDFTKVAFVDTSALLNLELVKKQLRCWAGDEVEFRFVGLNKHLRRRFQRAKWPLVDPFQPAEEEEEGGGGVVMMVGEEKEDKKEKKSDNKEEGIKDLVFANLSKALRYRSEDAGLDSTYEQIIMDIGKGF